MNPDDGFAAELDAARTVYQGIGSVRCPYLNTEVHFSSDGFHHLRYNTHGSERKKKAQKQKFRLFKAASVIVSKSGTVQEYRKQWGAVGRKKKSDGLRQMKEMQYWGFVAIVGEDQNRIRVRVIVRRVGTGTPHFWSVMSDTDLHRRQTYKLAHDSILDE